MSKQLECKDCTYYWKEENEEYARCHFEPVCWEKAPCDDEDYFTEPNYILCYDGAYFTDDEDDINTLEFDKQEDAIATYDGLVGAGFPIDKIWIKNTEYDLTYMNGEWDY